MTDWIMIIITAVYVIATIFICVANFKSAKATRDQITEQKRQFDETNRAYVTVHFEVSPSKLYTLCICNHGNKIAKGVHLEFEDSFIDKIKKDSARNHLINTKNSAIDIGIGQSWYIDLGNIGDSELMKNTVNIGLRYKDDSREYSEIYNIDLSSFNWQVLCSSEDYKFEKMKKIADSLEIISKNLAKITK